MCYISKAQQNDLVDFCFFPPMNPTVVKKMNFYAVFVLQGVHKS